MTTDEDIRLTFHAMVNRVVGELRELDTGARGWNVTMTADPFDRLDIEAANSAIANGMPEQAAASVRCARKLAREFGVERVRRAIAFQIFHRRMTSGGEDPHATPPKSSMKKIKRKDRRDPHVAVMRLIK